MCVCMRACVWAAGEEQRLSTRCDYMQAHVRASVDASRPVGACLVGASGSVYRNLATKASAESAPLSDRWGLSSMSGEVGRVPAAVPAAVRLIGPASGVWGLCSASLDADEDGEAACEAALPREGPLREALRPPASPEPPASGGLRLEAPVFSSATDSAATRPRADPELFSDDVVAAETSRDVAGEGRDERGA